MRAVSVVMLQKPPVDGRFITFISGKTSPGSHSTPSCYESSDSHTYHNTPIAETDVSVYRTPTTARATRPSLTLT